MDTSPGELTATRLKEVMLTAQAQKRAAAAAAAALEQAELRKKARAVASEQLDLCLIQMLGAAEEGRSSHLIEYIYEPKEKEFTELFMKELQEMLVQRGFKTGSFMHDTRAPHTGYGNDTTEFLVFSVSWD